MSDFSQNRVETLFLEKKNLLKDFNNIIFHSVAFVQINVTTK
jgi:hypothetical protein